MNAREERFRASVKGERHGNSFVAAGSNGTSPSRKSGGLLRSVGNAMLDRFTRDKPTTAPVAGATLSLERRGTTDSSGKTTDTRRQNLSRLPPTVSDLTFSSSKPRDTQRLAQPNRHSWFRSHSAEIQGDRVVQRKGTTESEVLEDVLKEQETREQEVLELKKRLLDKEELIQTLVNQQTKHQTKDEFEETEYNPVCSCSEEMAQRQIEIQKLRLANENSVFELSEKEEEIRTLKERYESRHQRIKCLEVQKSELSVQAKTFEVDYLAELEQNKLLQKENEQLKHQLATTSLVASEATDYQDCSVEDDRCRCIHLSVIVSLRAQLKELNEDIVRVRDHTKEQSRQILVYRQQAEMSEEMEGQLKSMEGKNQELEEEQGKLQEKLREARTESHRLHCERKLLDNELKTSKKETLRFSVEKDDLKLKYDTVVAENNQLLKNIEKMSELSLQVVEANKRIKDLEQQLALDQVQMKQYQDDFRQEREDRETAHGLIADMEKECIKGGEMSNYQQLSDRLREMEEANKRLLEDLETVRREAREEQEMVHQEMQAKSSQVKQYAKENDRLKKALEEAGSKLSSSIPHVNGENRPFICSREDLENLRDENVRHREKIDQLEIINAQLQENQAASTASTSLPTENSESVPGLINNHVGRTIKSWPQESTCGQASESPQTGSRIEADSANLQGQIVESESGHVGQDKLECYSRQSSNDYENWPIDDIIPEEETSAPVPNETEGTSSTYDHIDVCKQQEAGQPHPSPHHIDQHHMLPAAALEVSSTNYSQRKMLNFGSEGQPITGSNTNCEAIQLDDFNNREQRETTHPLEDSTVLFENPLQRELDDEIHQQAAQVIQEVSGSRREVNTDLKRPFDPNLVCPMCRKQFRIGEIQRFRRHVNTCTGTSDD